MQIIIHERKNAVRGLPKLVTRPFTIDPSRIKIDLENYIYVPQNKVFITANPFDNSERRDWNETQLFLADRGLFMPTASIFMNYYVNLRDTSRDKSDMYDAEGNEISIAKAFGRWELINSTNKYGPACSTWLDNLWNVRKSTEYGKNDEITMISDNRVKINRGTIEIKGKERNISIPPRKYSQQVKLPLNEQGLPSEWVESSECAPGLTIDFNLPEDKKATQYLSGKIDCAAPRDKFAQYIFACAYSID